MVDHKRERRKEGKGRKRKGNERQITPNQNIHVKRTHCDLHNMNIILMFSEANISGKPKSPCTITNHGSIPIKKLYIDIIREASHIDINMTVVVSLHISYLQHNSQLHAVTHDLSFCE